MGPRRQVMFPFFGDGIFTQDGLSWKHSRELLRPQFAQEQYEDLEVFCGPVDDLINALPNRGIVDLQPLFFRFTLDTTTAFLFGESVNSLRAPESTSETTFATAFNVAQDCLAKRMRLPTLSWLIGRKRFTKACEEVHRFVDQIIDRNLHNENDRGRYVFLNSLAKETEDRTALRSHIINILVAGRDTTASVLTWILYATSAICFRTSLNSA